MTDPFDTVREALQWTPEAELNFPEGGPRSVGLAALASIEERLRETEKDASQDDLRVRLTVSAQAVMDQRDRAEAAERERDELKAIGRRMVEQVDELAEGRIERNARIAELEAALHEIADGTTPDRIGKYDLLRNWIHKTARAALASGEDKP